MKVAVIGTGIAGNVAAFKLQCEHDITVFEANSYIGGHTNTVDVVEDGQTYAVDTGFIVYNERTYPNFIRLLDELGQASQQSEMSFSVQANNGGIEYNGASLNALFAQRRNVFRPSFYRMLKDILRFNEIGSQDSIKLDDEESLAGFLHRKRFSREFAEHYLIPMAAAIWSAERSSVLEMPISFLIRFFANHGLLQLGDRPVWRVIKGGSRQYVRKLVAGHVDRIRLASPVESVRRRNGQVEIYSASGGRELFDAVFMACHSDQALALLRDATPIERDVLGAIEFQSNEAILHTDQSLMPSRRRAWAAWNYRLPQEANHQVAVTYNMNILQGLEARKQFLVTLNNRQEIDERKIIRTEHYDHPVFSRAALAAQARHAEICGPQTYFCGAYWRNGFHEDGVVSALKAVELFNEELSGAQLHLRRAG